MSINFTRSKTFFSYLSLKLAVLFALMAVCIFAKAQVSMEQLLNIDPSNGKRFDQAMKRLGLKYHGITAVRDSSYLVYAKQPLPAKNGKQLLKCQINGSDLIIFQTSSPEEIDGIEQQFLNSGFNYPSIRKSQCPFLYQKDNIVVSFSCEESDSGAIYSCSINRSVLPKAKEIVYAEDLLRITSHEFLCSVFGASNVKKDYFYFSENRKVPCSVLFPNTKLEAVFVWEDAVNYKDILALRIGGDPQTQSSLDFNRSIEQNVWQSKKGLYIGMSLQEIQKRNLFNVQESTSSENFTLNAKKQNDALNNLGLIFSCLNCGDDRYFKANFANTSEEIDESRKVYVSTMVFSNEGR